MSEWTLRDRIKDYWRNCKKWYRRDFLNKATTWAALAALVLTMTWCVIPAEAGVKPQDYFPDDPLRFRIRWDSPPPRGIWNGVEELNIWWEKGYINIQHIVCWGEGAEVRCSVSSTIYLRPWIAKNVANQILYILENRVVRDGREIVEE